MKQFLSKCRSFFYSLRHSKLDAWILRGRELSAGEPLCIAYLGTAPLKNYYADLAFSSDGFSAKSIGKCWPVLFRFLVWVFCWDCSLIVYEMVEEHSSQARFLGSTVRNPAWMQLEINLSGDLESSMRKRQYKNITKQIEKAGLSYEIRTDDEAFEEFYRKIYLPSVVSRHGDTAMLVEYEALKKRYKQGEIVMIKQGAERVGGALIDLSEAKPRFMVMGTRDGSAEYVKMGVASAVYYFEFLHMLEKGGCTANMGSSRGFLRDRPLKFKLSLGAYLAGVHVGDAGFLYLKARKITPGLKAFLINNPFFILDRAGKYWASIFIDSVQSVPDAARELIKDFRQEFISPQIYSFDSPEYLFKNAAVIKTSLGDCPVQSAYSLFR